MSKKSEEIAKSLDGIDYVEWRMGSPRLKDIFQTAKINGCVIIYGLSDDLMEFSGYIEEEIGAWEGQHAYIANGSLLEKRCDECEECPYYSNERNSGIRVDLRWDVNGYSWWTETNAPYSEFYILEKDEADDKYCRGIVIDLNEAKEWRETRR